MEMFSFKKKDQEPYKPFEEEGGEEEEQKGQEGVLQYLNQGGNIPDVVGDPRQRPPIVEKIKVGVNSAIDQSRGEFSVNLQQLQRGDEENQGQEGEEGEEEEQGEEQGEGEGEGEGEEEDQEEEQDYYGDNYDDNYGYDYENEYGQDAYQGEEQEEEQYEEGLEDYEQGQFEIGGQESEEELDQEKPVKPVEKVVKAEYYKQDEKKLAAASQHSISALDARRRQGPVAPPPEKQMFDLKVDEMTDAQATDYLNQQRKVRQAMKQRKTVRFTFYFIYLILMLIAIVVACKFLMIRSDFVAAQYTNFNFTIDNCTLLITDKTDSSLRSPIYIKYQVPTQLLPNSPTTVTVDEQSDPVTMEVLNGIDPRYCLIKMFVQSGTPLGSMTINCPHCNITQDTSTQLQVQDLAISGEVVYANFRDVKAKSFNYETVTGFIQLNNIETLEGENTITVEQQGDIIIQSIQDFRLDGESNTQAFCLSGPALKQVDVNNCQVAGENSTIDPNSTCRIVYDICSSRGCGTPATTFTVKSTTGNIYANVIPAVGMPVNVNTTSTVMGQVYDDGIGFDPESDKVISGFDTLAADQSKGNPFILFDLGNFASRSSLSTRWVISSTPSYSLLRPWWIGTFSATILNGYVERVQGFLLPGFCPFIPVYTNEHLLAVEQLIDSKINNTLNTLVTFVQDDSMPQPPDTAIPSTGVMPLISSGDPKDKWYTVELAPSGQIVIENNNYTKKGTILATVIVSLVIAIYVSCIAMNITFVGINKTYTQLRDFANHLDSYSKLERSQKKQPVSQDKKDKKKQQKAQSDEPAMFDSWGHFMNILKNAPSPSAFIDYLTLILYRRYSSSVAQFYNLLFDVADKEPKKRRSQRLDPTKNMINGTAVKILYEKFCFMNHLTEEKLTDPENINILQSYGFEISASEDQKIEVFIRVDVKNWEPFLVNTEGQDNIDSLDLFMKENVEVTQFVEDQVDVARFIRTYSVFCDYNRLPRVMINPGLMKDKFGVDIDMVPQQVIMRIPNLADQPVLDVEPEEKSFWQKYISMSSSPESGRLYIINQEKLEKHFNLVMGVNMSVKDIQEATVDLILYPGWILWDALTVLVHLLIGGFVTLPIVCFVILNESQYEPWSLEDPLSLIRFQDIIHDPAQTIYNLYHTFSWNIALMILVTILWIISFFDLLWYYAVMDFPQDKSFKNSEKQVGGSKPWKKLNRQVEWILVFTSLALYFGYIGLLLTWLLLGAFINPNAFLPFASAAATFITFVVAKYNSFKQLISQGTKAVMAYVEQIFGGYINDVLSKVVGSIEKAAPGLSTEKLKQVVGSEGFKNITDKLGEVGVIDPNTMDEYAEKIQAFDPQNIIAIASSGGTVAPQAAVEVQKEIVAQKAASKELANIMKAKTIDKIKVESAKRKIPQSFVELMIAASSKDTTQIQALVKKIIEECHPKLDLLPDSAEVISELLFAQSLHPEEMTMFLTVESINLIFKAGNIDKVPGLSAEVVVRVLRILRYLDRQNYDAVAKEMIHLFSLEQNRDLEKMKLILPIVTCIATMASQKANTWNAEAASLELLNASNYMLGDNRDNNTKDMLKGVINFLPVLLAKKEVPTDLDSRDRESLDSYGVSKAVLNFCKALKLNLKQQSDGSGGPSNARIIPNLVHLWLGFLKQDIHDVPREVLKGIERKLEPKIYNTTDFLTFWLKIVQFSFQKSVDCHTDFNKCLSRLDSTADFKNFMRILTCYSLKDFDRVYQSIKVEKNTYFVKLADALKVDPRELLGLIDLIYQKNNSRNINIFLRAMMSRSSLNLDNTELIEALVQLFLSEDETELLHVAKILNLEDVLFLLIGKGCLDPKALSAKQFEDAGVYNKDLVDKRNSIATASEEDWLAWKSDLRQAIVETLQRTRKSFDEEINKKQEELDKNGGKLSEREYFMKSSYINTKKEKMKRVEAKANLTRLFLSDWDSYTFSRKNVELAIKSADNKDNQLERKLIEEEGGSYDGADVIPIIMDIKYLKLHQNGRYDAFTKERESAVTNYARYLGINADTLRKIVQMFVLNDKKLVLSLFLEFFPDEKEYQQEINKILSYGFKQVNNIQKQVEFVREQFTKSISLPGQKSPLLPYKFFEKLLLNDYFKANFGLGSLFDVILMQTAKYKLDPAIQDALLTECCRFAMFMKGNLPRTVVEKDIGVKNPVVLSIFDILAEPNIDKRMASFTKLFVKRNDPIKVAIAFYGLLTNRNFNVNHADASDDMPDGESLKSYLSSTLEVASELFDMFELAYERDPTKFLTKSFPLMRRLLGSPVVNTSFMESLFMLSFGEHFNSNNLASKLGISSDNIEFFVFLVRLSKKTSRKKELNDLPQFVPVNKVLSKLKVKPTELTCLVKLIFSMFDSDESLLNIITELKLKSKDPQADRKTEVNIDIFKGFAALSKPVDPKIDVYKNKKILNNTKEKINALFEALGLNQYKNSAFMLANLAAGNFLVLREYVDDLDWYIPTHNEDAKYFVQNLTMGLSGLLNSSIEVEDDLAKSVKGLIPKYKPYDTAETMLEKPGDKDLPTNSIAYAVCLLYQTFNITPALTQAFMMDRRAFTDIQSEYPDLKPDFLWAMVLQFIDKTDTLGDVMGLYEWVGAAANFYKSKTDSDAPQCPATEFRQRIDSIDKHLSEHMDFSYRAVKLLATNRELLQTQPWKLIFSKHTRYNARVNQSLMFLLTFDVDADTKKTYAEQIQDLTRKEPYEFLDDLTRILPPDDSINHPEKEVRVGRLIRKALCKCYEVISKYHLRTQATKEKEQAVKAEAEKDQVNKSVAEKDQANKSLAGEANKAEAGQGQATTDPDMKGLTDFALTDLCTLGTISFLRQDPSISTDRKLYNLHQVASNIERKLCFNNNYIYLSRIKLMKLLGVSLNLQVSSLNEWSFPQTLFTYDYIDGIELSEDNEYCEDLKVEWCKNFVFSDGKHVCDMGALYGTFYTANQNIDQWLGCKDWDEIALLFQLDEWYLCDYSIDSIERFRAMNEYRTFYQLQDDGDENHPRVFRPLEVLRLMFDENENVKQFSESRKGYGRENIPSEAAVEDIVDTKTGLSYKDLLSKMMDFEKVLLDPNTELVFSVIRGEVSAFLKTDHALAPNDPEKKRAKSYMALTGLQSLRRKKKKQGLLLKDYLGILAGQLDSEIACLEEILTFIVDKPIVSEISSILDIDDITANFLLMNVKEGVANDEEEDQAAEEKDSILGFIRKKFPTMPDRELQVFDIIRNIYLLRKQPGWMDALRLLKKDGKRYSELQKSGVAKSKKNDTPDHPLAPLFNLIDFTKLRNQATTPGEEKMIFNTIGSDTNEAARMDKLFNYILDLKIYKSDGLNKETLKQQYNATMLLLRLEFREAFKTLVLTGSQKAKDTAAKSGSSSQNTLESFLELFGVNLSKKPEDRNDILYLKLFLILNQDDQRALKGADPKEIDKLINDMERLDFLRSLTSTKGPNVKKQKLEICQILFATLAWDSKLVLESFAQEDTLDEGYILYDIYTCCNLNRFRAKKSEFKWNFLGLLRSSICHFVPDGISKSILINDPTPELQEYSTQRSQRSVEDLQKKIEDLCKTLDDKKNNPAEPLAYFLLSDERVEQEKKKKSPFAEGQTSQILIQEEVDMNKIYTGQAEYTIPNVVVSLADFNFLSRLLNTFTDQSSDQYKRLSLILKIMTDFEIPQPSDPRFGEMYDKNVLDLLGQLLQQTYEQDPQSNEPVKCLFELLPLVLLITMLFQLNLYYLAEIMPILITNSIEGIKGKMPDPTQSAFISDLVTIILGIKTPITKKLDKAVFEERMRTLFNRVRAAFFPDVAETAFDNWFLKTHELAQRLESDVMPNMKDIQKRREISKNILKIFGVFKLCSHDLMDALFAMLDGDLTKFQAKFAPIAPRLGISPHSFPQMVKYLKEAQNLLTGDFFTKPSQFTPALPAPTQAAPNVSAEDWAAMLKKIKEGTASSKDLFNMVDAAGDSSGSISETEFSTLAGRLGLKLSPHRVKEIFAKVKGQKADASNQDLNADEFDKALNYLQEKNLQQALLLLGITPEILTGVLIRLTILLLLLFVFIFLGIKAFAVGGTFGSIINSLFPMAGGTALGKEKEGESKLEDSSVKEATDKGFEITTSEQL